MRREDSVPDVVRLSRTLAWRQAAAEIDALRPMFLDQLRREDLRGKLVLDLGTGEGRLAFEAARLGARVVGVDLDRNRLAHARAYAGIRDVRRAEFVWGDVEKTPYDEFTRDPIDVVVSNLCMSAEIVSHASRTLRPGGAFIFCCHHGDHWRDKPRGFGGACFEHAMANLLEEHRAPGQVTGVDTTIPTLEDFGEVAPLPPRPTRPQWGQGGRWDELDAAFAR